LNRIEPEVTDYFSYSVDTVVERKPNCCNRK